MRIAILGVGLIGGSIGLGAKERLQGTEVTGWSRTRATLDRALQVEAIDAAARLTAPTPTARATVSGSGS